VRKEKSTLPVFLFRSVFSIAPFAHRPQARASLCSHFPSISAEYEKGRPQRRSLLSPLAFDSSLSLFRFLLTAASSVSGAGCFSEVRPNPIHPLRATLTLSNPFSTLPRFPHLLISPPLSRFPYALRTHTDDKFQLYTSVFTTADLHRGLKGTLTPTAIAASLLASSPNPPSSTYSPRRRSPYCLPTLSRDEAPRRGIPRVRCPFPFFSSISLIALPLPAPSATLKLSESMRGSSSTIIQRVSSSGKRTTVPRSSSSKRGRGRNCRSGG
jgi:hypothetical protein